MEGRTARPCSSMQHHRTVGSASDLSPDRSIRHNASGSYYCRQRRGDSVKQTLASCRIGSDSGTGPASSSILDGDGASHGATNNWFQDDVLWNSAPSAGGAPGWVCTTGGTPGTWKAMANLPLRSRKGIRLELNRRTCLPTNHPLSKDMAVVGRRSIRNSAFHSPMATPQTKSRGRN